MKVTLNQKISNLLGLTHSSPISNGLGLQHDVAMTVITLFVRKSCLYENGELRLREHTVKRIMYFLVSPKGVWLLISSLFFQIVNPVLIDPVFALTNYKVRGTYPQTRYLRDCHTTKQSQALILRNKCVSFIKLTRKSSESKSSIFNIREREKTNSSQKSPVCVQENIETLMTELLRNLPAYANRASQRARRLSRTTQTYSYMLMAGKPEFAPLPTNPVENTENISKNSQDKDVKQVFFTTLERQYIKGKPIQSQQFHWLFLTKAEDGWQMVMMFTQTGSYPKSKPPTPPRDSTNGVVGQAIQTWLRDCRAADNRSRKN